MSSTQSPEAADTQVWTRVPGSCRWPVRRSRTWPSTRSTTHDWQMPIRQPKGSCTPAPSPASINDVAASAATLLPLRANVTVPPAPAGAVLDTANRSRCSRSLAPADDQTLSAWLSTPSARTPRSGVHASPAPADRSGSGPAGPGRASRAPTTDNRDGRPPGQPARHRTSRQLRWAPNAGALRR